MGTMYGRRPWLVISAAAASTQINSVELSPPQPAARQSGVDPQPQKVSILSCKFAYSLLQVCWEEADG